MDISKLPLLTSQKGATKLYKHAHRISFVIGFISSFVMPMTLASKQYNFLGVIGALVFFIVGIFLIFSSDEDKELKKMSLFILFTDFKHEYLKLKNRYSSWSIADLKKWISDFEKKKSYFDKEKEYPIFHDISTWLFCQECLKKYGWDYFFIKFCIITIDVIALTVVSCLFIV